jgi:hypothetical protein
MDNPDILATISRQDTERRQTKHSTENYKDEQQIPHKQLEANAVLAKGIEVPAS